MRRSFKACMISLGAGSFALFQHAPQAAVIRCSSLSACLCPLLVTENIPQAKYTTHFTYFLCLYTCISYMCIFYLRFSVTNACVLNSVAVASRNMARIRRLHCDGRGLRYIFGCMEAGSQTPDPGAHRAHLRREVAVRLARWRCGPPAHQTLLTASISQCAVACR